MGEPCFWKRMDIDGCYRVGKKLSPVSFAVQVSLIEVKIPLMLIARIYLRI
jgi:hypothetical protein